mgnify:FL=1
MGTSSSSSGPGAGVPFDPPWLSSVASEIGSPLEQISGDGAQQEQTPQQAEPVVQPSGIAPPRRFGNARRYMGELR